MQAVVIIPRLMIHLLIIMIIFFIFYSMILDISILDTLVSLSPPHQLKFHLTGLNKNCILKISFQGTAFICPFFQGVVQNSENLSGFDVTLRKNWNRLVCEGVYIIQ